MRIKDSKAYHLNCWRNYAKIGLEGVNDVPQIYPIADSQNSFAAISVKLREAEVEAETTQERFLHEDVMSELRQKLQAE